MFFCVPEYFLAILKESQAFGDLSNYRGIQMGLMKSTRNSNCVGISSFFKQAVLRSSLSDSVEKSEILLSAFNTRLENC